jgi:hypothetical protein
MPLLLTRHTCLRRTLKAAASGRHYPEPLRAPLPIGNMRDAATVNTAQSPPPKGVPPATKAGVVIAALAPATQPAQPFVPGNLLPNKMRGNLGHISNVAGLAGLHGNEAEPVSETFKTMV